MSITGIGVVPPVGPIGPAGAAGGVTGASRVASPQGGGFATSLAGAVDNLSAVQAKADDLAVQAATGTLTNAHDYLIAASEASLTTQMTVAVRNKAIEAFNEIMRMPL
ncbi:MAG: flagellar hook-basal body complex protein FliE [Candidatus Nanopelagicales bacterium]|jgi:flagellar hook-basal body complex protein FliE